MIDTQALIQLTLNLVGSILALLMTVHYARIRDGRARIGLIALVGGIGIGQLGNIAIVCSRQLAPAWLDGLRIAMLGPELVIVGALAWLAWVSL